MRKKKPFPKRSYSDIENEMPIDKEIEFEHYIVESDLSHKVILHVKARKTDVNTYICSWGLSYDGFSKIFSMLEYNLDFFQAKTEKVKKILECYVPNEGFKKYIDEHIPVVQEE